MSNPTSAGATSSATRSAVVEAFAFMAMLTTTMTANDAIQPPTTTDRNTWFNMASTRAWVGLDSLGRQ